MPTLKDYAEAMPIAWCPGCGNFGILTALRRALVEQGLEPYQVLLVSGIGQAGKTPHFTHAHVLNELHGRALPAASAAKIVNPELTVIAIGGDGDGYGEGGNHFIHSMRRNIDITYFVHDNQVYGLTKGQASPTSDLGFPTKTTPDGAPDPVNPLALAVAADASFVARGFAGEVDHLVKLMGMAIKHKGFALVDILQPCVSFNHKNTYAYYKQRVYKLDDDKSYDPTNKAAAFAKTQEWGDRIPIGLIYRKERPTFRQLTAGLGETPPVKLKLDPLEVEDLVAEFL